MKYIPFDQVCEYRGLQGHAGSFEKTDEATGSQVQVDYSDQHRFEFEHADGTLDDVLLRADKIDQAAPFNVDALKKGEFVRVQGRGGASTDMQGKFRALYVTPDKIEKTTALSAAKAA